jgi:hypothetical protein
VARARETTAPTVRNSLTTHSSFFLVEGGETAETPAMQGCPDPTDPVLEGKYYYAIQAAVSEPVALKHGHDEILHFTS